MAVRRARFPEAVAETVRRLDVGDEPDRATARKATLHLLTSLADRAPGHSIEVRVPPYGAIQCGDGPRHTRGTPPNVVEMDAITWLRLASGRLDFAAAVAHGAISASGGRADLTEWLPLISRLDDGPSGG